jgi:polygalacturonase
MHLRPRRFLSALLLLSALAGPLAFGAGASDRVLITDFGASTDAGHVNTKEIQSAIDHCAGAGGGVVVIPAGTFVTGTLLLHSHVRLELSPGALLLGSTNLDDYPMQPTPAYRSLKDAAGFRALIYAENQENISLGGQGTIDGQGASFKWGGNDMDGRPRLLLFISCRDVRVEDLQLRNSGIWMEHYLNCEDVHIRGLRVWNHANRNNDMLDLDGCRRVTVSDCIGDSEDDGITLKATGPASCEDIAITNCVLSSQCNAIKCGTESTGGFRNITISNCAIKPSRATNLMSGLRSGLSGIALESVDGGVLDGVTISNITITGTDSPLFIRLGNRARKYRKDADVPPVGAIRNISITNVLARGTGATGSSITGLPGHPVENIWLSGIRLEEGASGTAAEVGKVPVEKDASYPESTMYGKLPAYGLFVRHAVNVRLSDVVLIPLPGDPRPAYASADVQGAEFYSCSFAADHGAAAAKP